MSPSVFPGVLQKNEALPTRSSILKSRALECAKRRSVLRVHHCHKLAYCGVRPHFY
jgi:hypothetical protein